MEAKHADDTKPIIDNEESDKSAVAIPSTVTNEAEANKAILQAAEKFLTSTDQLRTLVDLKINVYLSAVKGLHDIKYIHELIKQETDDFGNTELSELVKTLKQKTQQDTPEASIDLLENIEKSAANIYIDFALKAMSSEHFDLAETFVRYAHEIYPTEKDRELSEIIQQNVDLKINDNVAEEEIISLAKTAFYEQDYQFAEVLLTYLKIERNSKAVQHLLEVVVHFNSKQQIETTNDMIDKRYKRCCDLTLHMILENRLKIAEFLMVFITDSWMRSSWSGVYNPCLLVDKILKKLYGPDAKELSQKIEDLENKLLFKANEYNSYGVSESNLLKCNIYMKRAIRAHLAGKNKVANDFVLEVQKIIYLSDIIFSALELVSPKIRSS